MPDNSERKRLRKKMLERWENEGGRIAADSVIADKGTEQTNARAKAIKPPLRTIARELRVFRLAKEGALVLTNDHAGNILL